MNYGISKAPEDSIQGVKCPFCAQIIISHYTHDFHRCRCGYTFVDGGRSYLRFGWGFGFAYDERPDWATLTEKCIGIPEIVDVRLGNDGSVG